MQVSISQIKCFKACRRQYELRYNYGVEPVEKSEALTVGTSYHGLLEELYNTGKLPEGITREHAMAKAYMDIIYPRFEVSSVENWVRYDIGNGDQLIGRIDGMTKDGLIVEHKTTSSEITEAYEYNLLWDEQILAYMLCTDSRQVWYTVCRKPSIRLCKNETEEAFYERMCEWYKTDTDKKIKLMLITRTDEEVERFRQELRDIVLEIKYANAAELRNPFYRNTCYCNMWGRRCEYSPICLDYDPNQEYIEFKRRESVRDESTEVR